MVPPSIKRIPLDQFLVCCSIQIPTGFPSSPNLSLLDNNYLYKYFCKNSDLYNFPDSQSKRKYIKNSKLKKVPNPSSRG